MFGPRGLGQGFLYIWGACYLYIVGYIIYNCVFPKKEKKIKKPFTFENENIFRKKNHILKMKAHFETYFENENMSLEK